MRHIDKFTILGFVPNMLEYNFGNFTQITTIMPYETKVSKQEIVNVVCKLYIYISTQSAWKGF